MEPLEAEIRRKIFVSGFADGVLSAAHVVALASAKRLHPDFTMNRVIRDALVEVVKSLQEYHDKYKEAQCPPSPSTNPTTKEPTNG